MRLTSLTRRTALVGTLQTALALITASKAQAITSSAHKTSIVVAIPIEPPSLDPTMSSPVAVGMVTWSNIFEGLVTIDEHGKIQPKLASDWVISDNGLTYTFSLRKNVTFHDGAVFDSSVAKFALESARAPQSKNPQKRFFAQIDRIETPDPFTLVLYLKQRNRSLLYWLGWPASVIVAPNSADTNANHPIGTGPFRFEHWEKGKSIQLTKYDGYWDKSITDLQSVTIRFEGNMRVLAQALKTQEVDAVPEFNRPDLIAELQNDPTLKTVIGVTEMKVVAAMNNARKPFNDLRVRQALMMAVDRNAMIGGAWDGLGTAIGSHYTPNDRAYQNLTGIYPYDPIKAKALLKEAGYPKGFSFTMRVPQMAYATRSIEILHAAFAEIGVTMIIQPTTFPQPWTRDVFERADYDMTIIAHAEPMDIDIYARPNAYFNYRNPAFNALIERIEQATSDDEQNQLYAEAQTMLAKDVPALFLFTLPKIGIWNNKLSGMWENEPISSIVLSRVRWENDNKTQ
jgi:peptide/nickel transport system substrate-binding protein